MILNFFFYNLIIIYQLSLILKAQTCKYDEVYQEDGKCIKCNSQCVSCFGPSDNDCFKCKGYMNQQVCKTECQSNYFKEITKNICETCNIPYCEKCLNSKQCEKCEDNFKRSSQNNTCVFQSDDLKGYAYYDIDAQKLVQTSECPNYLEQTSERTCSYPKICSQENYIGEFNSNCFNIDEDGLKFLIQSNYTYYYSKKEVYVFDLKTSEYVHYLQNLNSDKDIQTIQGIDDYMLGGVYIIYDNIILKYQQGVSQLSQLINMPNKQVQNTNNTLILKADENEINSGIWLVTTSVSMQDSNICFKYSQILDNIMLKFFKYVHTILFYKQQNILTIQQIKQYQRYISYSININQLYLIIQKVYVIDLESQNIRFSFQIGQKIFQYFVLPENKKLIIITLLRISIHKSFLSSETSQNLDIGEENQVNWIKSFSLQQKNNTAERIFVILNGWSILLMNTTNYTLTQVVATSENGYLLNEKDLLTIVYQDSIYFLDVYELLDECKINKLCLQQKDTTLIKHTHKINPNDEYLIEAFNEHIYMSIKDSYELYIYDSKFNRKQIYSDFQKPIKSIQIFNKVVNKVTIKQLVVTHDNNSKIFSAANPSKDTIVDDSQNLTKQLFQFCNEKNIEIFNEELKEFGANAKDEFRNILIYAAVSIQGNIVIFMKQSGQAIFYKELNGDETINQLSMVRKNFQIFVNPEKRLIKLFGIQNGKNQQLVITIEYFTFKINKNYEVYSQFDSIISNDTFKATKNQGEQSCIYSFKIDLNQSQKITCLSTYEKSIKTNSKYIAIAYISDQIQNNKIKIIPKDLISNAQEQKIEQLDFSFEFLDDQTILVLSVGKFYKFKIDNIPNKEVYDNQIKGSIKNYQIHQSNKWMLIQEYLPSGSIFHFIDLLNDTLSNVYLKGTKDNIFPEITQNDSEWFRYNDTLCSFLIMQPLFGDHPYFQIISSELANYQGRTTVYKSSVVSYIVMSNSEFQSAGKKRIEQFIKTDDQMIIEGSYSQSKLLFYNQLNIKEQINVLCNQNCQISGKIDNYQLLYQRWHLPNIIKQFSTDKIFFNDYYQNTMYSDKWHLIGMEAYQLKNKTPIPLRIELIIYPEKQIIFRYIVGATCSLFSFQLVSNFDTLLICDNLKIKVFDLAIINQNFQKNKTIFDGNLVTPIFQYDLKYPITVEKMIFFSSIEPAIYFNGYGVLDYMDKKFYSQNSLQLYTKGKESTQQIMETQTHLNYYVDNAIFSYNKQLLKTDQQQYPLYYVVFLNKKLENPYLEKDFIIGLTQLRDTQQVQIFDYSNLDPIKSFYELEQEQFNKQGYYFYCWQYQKLFLRYDSSIIGYEYPFSAVQDPFFTYKTKVNVPRACSNTYLLVYEDTEKDLFIRLVSYKDASVIKQYTIFKSVQRVATDLFIKQKNIAIIEAKQVIVIGNILISTSQSDFIYIFQDSKFHYSPSLDVAFIHQQSLEKYIQVIDMSSIFPFILERFSFEADLKFENYFENIRSTEYTLPTTFNSNASGDELIFVNLMLNQVCFYDIYKMSYKLINLPPIQKNNQLEAKKSYRMQYRIYLNKQADKRVAVINFDRDFYLYSNNKYIKSLNLREYQEIHIDTQNDQVYIYGFKDDQVQYITIDNVKEDFEIKTISQYQYKFNNFLIISREYNQQYAMIDNTYVLVAQQSSLHKQCQKEIPTDLKKNLRGIKIIKFENKINDSYETKILILVWNDQKLIVYNFSCEDVWEKSEIRDGLNYVMVDDQTQQVYLADQFFIYVIRYQDIVDVTKKNVIVTKIPLQARGHIILQKINQQLLAILSSSNVYIYQVYKYFSGMFFITNKDFSYVKQIFLVEDEFIILADINRLYIYQIITDTNDYITSKLIKSLNSLSGSSSFSSTSSNNSSKYSNQGDSSEYYSSQQFTKRKQAVLSYSQINLYIQILLVVPLKNLQSLSVRIIGADYNNIIDLTKELKILDKHIKLSSLSIELQKELNSNSDSNNRYEGLFSAVQDYTEQELQQVSCRGEQVIHTKMNYQIIQYDTLFSQNYGLYNQIHFQFPLISSQSSDSAENQIKDLFIPNSLKLKAKKQTNFIYDLNKNKIYLKPYEINSTFIIKVKIMNGIIENILNQIISRKDSDLSNRVTHQLDEQYQNMTDQNQFTEYISSKYNKNRNLANQDIPPFIKFQNFKQIHLQNIELKQSLIFENCTSVILENISLNLSKSNYPLTITIKPLINSDSKVQLTNITVIVTMMVEEFLKVSNATSVNITDFKVHSPDSDQQIDNFQQYEKKKWIQITSCPKVYLNKFNFTNTNGNIDLIHIQDIDLVEISDIVLNKFNKNFDYIEFKAKNGRPQESNISSNEKGELISNINLDQEQLSYYKNIPLKVSEVFSVFKCIYIKSQFLMNQIHIQDSKLPMFLHFNKTIIINSTTNKSIKEQYEPTKLKITITGLTIEKLFQLQKTSCYNNDFIVIEALEVFISNFNVIDTRCYQAFIRCITCTLVNISTFTFQSTQNMNFLYYFYKNANVKVDNINLFFTENLQHIIGLITTLQADFSSIKVYPTLQVTIEPEMPQISLLPIRNCAFFIYSDQQIEEKTYETSKTNYTLTIKDSMIQYLNSTTNGTCIQVYNYDLIKLENVKLHSNFANKNGGSIYLFSSILELQNTQIYNNKAFFSGGAIYSLNSDIIVNDKTIIDNLQSTLISNNNARIGGGIRYFKKNLQILENSMKSLSKNSAVFFGRDYANYPHQFVFKDIEQTRKLDQIVSSISTVQTEISFYWIDQQGDRLLYKDSTVDFSQQVNEILKKEIEQYTTVTMESKKILINRVKDELEIKGEIVEVKGQDQHIKTDASFLLKPNEREELIIKTKINYPEDDIKDKTKRQVSQQQTIKMSFRECIAGEIFNSFNADSFECLECKDNTYFIDKPTSFKDKCLLCPDDAKKCHKNSIEVFDGYWIEPNTSNIYHCFNNPDKCQPKQKNGCSEGGYGPRCESCDYRGQIWEGKNYARYGRFKCEQCGEDQTLKYLYVVILISVFGLFQAYLAHQVTLQTQTTLLGHYLKRAGIINLGLTIQGIGTNSLIKFIVGYFQIIQVLTSFNFRFSLGFLNAIYFFGNPLQISYFFLDCLYIEQRWIHDLEIVYIRLIWSLINSLIYLLISVLFSFAYVYFEKNKQPNKLKVLFRFARTSQYQLFYLMFPSLISQFINIISCERIGTQKYIYADNQFLCNSKQHLYIGYPIAIPLLVLMIVVFPAFIYYQLKKNQTRLYHISFYLKYRFFFSEYKDSCYYWEIVKMAQKGLIYIGLSIYNENQIAKGAIVSLIMTIYIRNIYILKPYKRLFLNQIDFAASFTLLICFQIGMINMASNDSSVQNFSFYLIVFCNIFFIIYFFALVIKEKIPYHNKMILFPCIEYCIKKIPCLKKVFHKSESIYVSHKGWRKVRQTIKRIGYQNLPLFLPKIQNNQIPSIDLQIKQDNNLLGSISYSQKSLSSERAGVKEISSFQQQIRGLGTKIQSLKKKNLQQNQLFLNVDIDLREVNSHQFSKIQEQEMTLMEPNSAQKSLSLQVPDENLGTTTENQINTAQKLNSTSNLKLILSPNSKSSQKQMKKFKDN